MKDGSGGVESRDRKWIRSDKELMYGRSRVEMEERRMRSRMSGKVEKQVNES